MDQMGKISKNDEKIFPFGIFSNLIKRLAKIKENVK